MAKYAPQLEPVHIPVKDHHAPSMDQARQWLWLCRHYRDNAGIYVHCKNGHGRASTFAILVRIAQGSNLQSAIDEQVRYGFPLSERAQIAFLEECYSARQSTPEILPLL